MDSRAERRLLALGNHLSAATANRQPPPAITTQPTAEQGYSVVLPEKLQTGKWNVYRNRRSPLKLITRFINHPHIANLHDHFENAVERFKNNNYLGTRVGEDGTVGEYKWMTYGEAGASRSAIGSGLINYQLPKASLNRIHFLYVEFNSGVGSCVGLYFINRPEWIIVDHACSSYSFVSIPLYDTLGPDAVKYIVNHASVQALFCVPQTFNILLSFLSEIPSVRLIVVVGGSEGQMPSLPSTTGVKIVPYSTLHSVGSRSLQPFRVPTSDAIATICYTSGTTGTPKGVEITHGNIIASIAGLSSGCDITKLLEDMAVLKPTIFFSVPRLYNKIHAGIMSAVKTSGALRERLFNVAYRAKKQLILNGKKPSLIWDRLVFNKIKQKLGGRVRFMVSGASPLSYEILDFLRVCFDCIVLEAYGMTESSSAMCIMDQTDNLSGHVGPPNGACEIKLEDVPEMNYTSEDKPYPRGEICVRGPIVFRGYYKDEVQTREAIDNDGWLHSGDIGQWLPGGRLKIIDRKKNIFKLSQGEYVSPEKIENVYVTSKFVAQCFIHGDSLNSCLVAIVSVDHDELKAWASAEGIKHQNLEQLCADPRARAVVLSDMNDIARKAQLRGFEYAKAVTLMLEPFTLENGLLTPTFKIKRPQARSYFAIAIADMYNELSAADASNNKLL
ncbi:long-chain-fatty-acid CoA ligase [Striga asiatica]|uniref:Long-chain-fatty-acid--CoA ligase n=1 Tax=Striga asiatica TaxID=4170 RepID=A0A5A7QHW7_STRAF|nr:long-chain-fatty-acid CoA ligase [Striga asiatica]